MKGTSKEGKRLSKQRGMQGGKRKAVERKRKLQIRKKVKKRTKRNDVPMVKSS